MKQVIQIRCKNNKKTQKVAIGSTLFDIFSEIGLEMSHGPISCKVNNKVEGSIIVFITARTLSSSI